MIFTKRTGDLLEQPDIDLIVHQANLEHTFGAGIARAIKQKFPYAYRADLKSLFNDPLKLGTFSLGIPDKDAGESGPLVVNLYSQTSLYPSHTSYDAIFEGLTELKAWLHPRHTKIGFPYQMGCGLADGNWSVVEAIINAVFEDSRFEIVIVKLQRT